MYEIVKEVTKIIFRDWGNWLRELYFSSRVLYLRAEKSTSASLSVVCVVRIHLHPLNPLLCSGQLPTILLLKGIFPREFRAMYRGSNLQTIMRYGSWILAPWEAVILRCVVYTIAHSFSTRLSALCCGS